MTGGPGSPAVLAALAESDQMPPKAPSPSGSAPRSRPVSDRGRLVPASPGRGPGPGEDRPPVGLLDPVPWLTAPETRAVMAALAAGGERARFVGGCVRDTLAHRLPVDGFPDIDITTTALPERTTALLEAAGIKVVPTGLAHGTVTAVCQGRPFEVTTLRRDTACDGRHAEVAFTTRFDEDARRRDFTINALSADIEGRVYDPFHGIADLTAGRIRFIGRPMDRIREDHLRILRFFRFFARFGRPPADRDALAACAALAPCLDDLSAERIRQELLGLLGSPDPAGSVTLMRGARVLDRILPEAGDPAPLRSLELLETRGLALPGLGPDPLRRLACLLGAGAGVGVGIRGEGGGGESDLAADHPPPTVRHAATQDLGRRLRLSRAETGRLAALLAAPATDWATPDDGPARLRQHLDRDGAALVTDRLLLAWARERSTGLHPRPHRTDAWRAMVETALGWQPPPFPLTGRDLTARGLRGPAVGQVLRDLRADWIAADPPLDRAALLARLDARVAAPSAGDGNGDR